MGAREQRSRGVGQGDGIRAKKYCKDGNFQNRTTTILCRATRWSRSIVLTWELGSVS
jgi:hypothetical protein